MLGLVALLGQFGVWASPGHPSSLRSAWLLRWAHSACGRHPDHPLRYARPSRCAELIQRVGAMFLRSFKLRSAWLLRWAHSARGRHVFSGALS